MTFRKLLVAFPWFTCQADILHAVDAIGSDGFIGIIVRQQIIVTIIDNKQKWADGICLAVPALNLLSYIFNGVFEILELDLFWVNAKSWGLVG